MKRFERLHVAGGMIFLVGVVLACKSSGSATVTPADAEATTSSASAAPTTTTSPLAAIERVDLTIGAAQLLKDYKGNEVRGDGKYKGKRVRLTGVVNEIKKDISDSIYVTIGTGAEFEIAEAQCFFDDKYTKQAARLTHGQKLTVDCECDGVTLMNVMMKDCDFVAKTAAMEACHRLEAAGIATDCVDTKPAGSQEITAFNVPGMPHKATYNASIIAFRLPNDEASTKLAKLLADDAKSRDGGGAQSFYSVAARVSVITDSTVSADASVKLKTAVDAL